MRGDKPFRRVFKDDDMGNSKKTYVSSDILLKNFIVSLLSKTKNKEGNDEISELINRDAFSYAKPEKLIKHILEITTEENDLILDFFLGSGTTAAVAHKMNRQYIGIEQMDYIENVTIERMRKVISGEQGGISKNVNWNGGGNFVYFELKNDALDFRNNVINAILSKELIKLLNLAKKSSFLSYRVN